MEFLTVWEVMEAIGSGIEVSETERAATLRLAEEVQQPPDAAAPSPFSGKTMGDLRNDVITGLARSFARAHKLSVSAAFLEHVLHHAEGSQPKLFDLRQTGLPRLNMSATGELREILFGVAKFEKRLVAALSSGKFRGFPRHGGAGGVGPSPDNWMSDPRDGDTLRQLLFFPAEIKPLLIQAGTPLGPMRDAFTGKVVEEFGPNPEPVDTLSGSNTGKGNAVLPINIPDLELVPMERTRSESAPDQGGQAKSGGSRTPRRFADEELDVLEQRHSSGEPWKKIAAELGMRKETLEGHLTAHRKRKAEASKQEAQASKQEGGNPYAQLVANNTIPRGAHGKRRPHG